MARRRRAFQPPRRPFSSPLPDRISPTSISMFAARVLCSWSKGSLIPCYSGGSHSPSPLSLASSTPRRPPAEISLRDLPIFPPQGQVQTSSSKVCKSGVRGAPHLTRILDLESVCLSCSSSPCVSSISTGMDFPSPLSPPSPPAWTCCCTSFIGLIFRQRTSLLGYEMGLSQVIMGLSRLLRFKGPHFCHTVSQPTLLMWGGLVSLINLLKIFSGFIEFFTETSLITTWYLSWLKSNMFSHLPVGSPGPSLPSSASYFRSDFPPVLWRCSSISITVLLACGAVRLRPEDASEFVSMNFRGADWMSTSQYKVTISLLTDYVVKAKLTHLSFVLSSLSSSSFEELSLLSHVIVVFVSNQRGWIILSSLCNQAI